MRRSAAICLVLVLAVILLLFVPWFSFPIYPDEIAHRFWTSRFFIDGQQRTSLFAVCEGNHILSIPWVFYPAGTILSLYSLIDNPAFNRILAILSFLACFMLLWTVLAMRGGKGRAPRPVDYLSLAGLVFIAMIGVTPAALVALRGEHFIMILIATLLLLAVHVRSKLTAGVVLPLSLVIFLIFSIAAYSHPKTLYFAPATLAIVILLCRGHRVIMIATSALVLLTISASIFLGSQFVVCPESEAVRSWVQNFNYDPRTLFSNPLEYFFQIFFWNVGGGRDWSEFLSKLTFRNSFARDINYLPGVSNVPPGLNGLIGGLQVINLVVGAGFFLVVASRLFSRLRNRRVGASAQTSEVDAVSLVLFLVYLAILTHLLNNRSQAWYDVAFYHSSLVVVNIFGILTQYRMNSWIVRSMALCGVALAVSSGYFAYGNITPRFATGWRDNPSTLLHHYAAIDRTEIETMRRKCLGGKDKVIFDNLTYIALQSVRFPTPIDYLAISFPGIRQGRPYFVTKYGFPGAIAECASLGLGRTTTDGTPKVCGARFSLESGWTECR